MSGCPQRNTMANFLKSKGGLSEVRGDHREDRR